VSNIALAQESFAGNLVKTVLAAKKTGNEYHINDAVVRKVSPMEYSITDKSVSPLGSGDLFGSGDSRIVSGSIWNYIHFRMAQQHDVLEIFASITQQPAEILKISSGVIENGSMADVILFKVESRWDLSDNQSVLKSIFLHQGNDRRVAGAFKNGYLVYASDEFSNLVKQNTLSKYYSQPNVAPSEVNGTYEFDSIESALEDFSMCP
jgi:hypothetical protein